MNKKEFTPGVPKEPPQTAGQMTKYKIIYVIISKMELIGPMIHKFSESKRHPICGDVSKFCVHVIPWNRDAGNT